MMVENGYVDYKPSTYEKIIKKLGFKYHLGKEPNTEGLTKWAMTNTYLNLSVFDRVRLLFTGRIKLVHAQHMNEDISKVVTRFDFQIYAPFEKQN